METPSAGLEPFERDEVGDESVHVKTGHSAWFDASRQHAYRNATTTPVTFTLVVFDSAASRTTELT